MRIGYTNLEDNGIFDGLFCWSMIFFAIQSYMILVMIA